MLPEQKVVVNWNQANKKHYESLGYKFTSYKEPFEISIKHLTNGSRALIYFVCDLCNNKVENVVYKLYIKQKQQNTLDIDCCDNCRNQKRKLTNLHKYGVESPSQCHEFQEKTKQTTLNKYGVEYYTKTNEIREKMRKTNLEKYGYENPSQSPLIKEKIKNTNLQKYGYENPNQNEQVKEKKKKTMKERYGVEHALQLDEFKNKAKDTTLQRFGVESAMQSLEIKEKVKQTNLERFGVENPNQCEEIRNKTESTNMKKYGVKVPAKNPIILNKMQQTCIEKYGVSNPMLNKEIRDKAINTMCEKGLVATSVPQIYLCNLLNGKLNHPVGSSVLDIAFLDENIYCELNGSGHTMAIYREGLSWQDFKKKEMRRWYALNYNNWKSIHIITRRDYLPSDQVILDLIQYAKDFLTNTPRSWITFDIDNKLIKTSKYTIQYDYGKLRKIKKSDLESQAS